MTLAKALKLKNRLAGELAKLRQQFQASNCRLETQPVPSVRTDLLLERIDEVENALITIKTDIAQATAPIVGKLIRLAESKSRIAFLNAVTVNEGSMAQYVGHGADATLKQFKYINILNEADRQAKIKEATTVVENLQDEIDEFNAVTKIAV